MSLSILSSLARRINVVPLHLIPIVVPVRYTSFFNTLTAEELWRGVTSVSNAGRKRGRGKGAGKRMSKNLNRGQVIGQGKQNIVWPGLNAPVIRGRELVAQQQLPEDPERLSKLYKMRDTMGVFKRLRIPPLERGWSGTKLPGRSIGAPDPVNGEIFEGFDTKCLEAKQTFRMTAVFGRRATANVFCVTGNQNGLAGIGLGKAPTMNVAIRNAKNRAGQRLMYIERYNNHTVLHDFESRFYRTKLYIQRKPEGYGLVCHRAIRTCCEVLGIKDIYAKVEGSIVVQNIVKAFFLGLMRQKSYQQMAEDTGLHVVEMRSENDFCPAVVASPTEEKEISPNDIPDFEQYCLNGKVRLRKKKYPPFYTEQLGWIVHLKKTLPFRNFEKVRKRMLVDQGDYRGPYSEKFPECAPFDPTMVYRTKKEKRKVDEDD